MTLQYRNRQYDLSKPHTIAIPFNTGAQVNCYYAPPFSIAPVVMGSFIGDVTKGSPVNYMNVQLNPHGNGTHTECIAHISDMAITVVDALDRFHFSAQVISITPTLQENGDRILMDKSIREVLEPGVEAVVLRTLPNDPEKKVHAYSGTNPAYLEAQAALNLRLAGVQHVLIDLPSLDREEDGGALAAHKAFWNYPEEHRIHSTITELIYVDNSIPDGLYLLNLQIGPLAMDAAPSNPVLYPTVKVRNP